MIIFYLIMGILFTYLAINSGADMWSFRTLLPTAIAVLDFGIAIRMIRIQIRVRRKK